MGIKLYRVIESEEFCVEGNAIYVTYDKNYSYLNYAIENLCKLIGVLYVPLDVEGNKTAIIESYLTREKENSIASLYPHLLEEWDYEKNGNIDPECVSRGSNLKLYWKCKKGHSWSAPPSSRTKGFGCPYCAGVKLLTGFNDLATKNPELLGEWDYGENGKLGITPDNISAGNSSQKVYWVCKNFPKHKWVATVADRIRGTGCPYCAEEQRKVSKCKTYVKKNGSFADKYPKLLEDWFYEKNDTLNIFPDKIPSHYSEVVWWKCHVCGYVWTATPDNRANGRGCSQCDKENHSQIMRDVLLARYGSLLQKNPEVAAFWSIGNNSGKTADDVTAKCDYKARWKCPKCGHQWIKRVNKMVLYPCCPKCRYSLNEKKKPIIQFDLELNEIARYDSPNEASSATKIARQYILATARHESKSTHGFVFRYEDDNTNINEFKPTRQPTPRTVLQYTKDGEFVKEWSSITKAQNAYSIAKGKITGVCKGQRKTAGGYIWRYKESR